MLAIAVLPLISSGCNHRSDIVRDITLMQRHNAIGTAPPQCAGQVTHSTPHPRFAKTSQVLEQLVCQCGINKPCGDPHPRGYNVPRVKRGVARQNWQVFSHPAESWRGKRSVTVGSRSLCCNSVPSASHPVRASGQMRHALLKCFLISALSARTPCGTQRNRGFAPKLPDGKRLSSWLPSSVISESASFPAADFQR